MPEKLKKNNGKKVLVGMSGGIDSSFAVFELLRQGYEVAGLYLDTKNFNGDRDYSRIKKIAKCFGIKVYRKKIGKIFQKEVVNYFLGSYEKNKTPNPCVVCNRQIKFRFLLEEVEKKKFDFIATGHYARVIEDKKGNFFIQKGMDEKKDQSYFLVNLSQNILKKVIFPLGDFRKKEIRNILGEELLKKISIGKESQDICFFSDKEKAKVFLERNMKKTKSGDVVDEAGRNLGRHKGLIFFTQGQRKGLGIAGGPYFVAKKKIKQNQLVVSRDKKDLLLLKKEIRIKRANWFFLPQKKKKYQIKIRYGREFIEGVVSKDDKGWKVVLDSPAWAVSEGQFLVAYDGKKLVGGGEID